jgi:Ca-activated chloride channel family protein
MLGRAIVLALAAVAVVIAFASSRGDDAPRATGQGTRPAAGAVRVSFVYSPEKEPLVKPLVARFNAERHRSSGGRPVFVEARNVASGDAQARIARGTLKPVAWSPASSLWGRLLNFEADSQYAPERNPSLVRTPLVIAMWEPMAKALGWPRKPLGWADVLRLAREPRGWAAVGRPEFGAFKLVHTNPDFSTSGLSAVVGEYYAATGKKEGLREEDVKRGAARRTVRRIERAIVHYGDTTLFIAEQLRRHGAGYASAVAMEEATLLEFNRRRRGGPKLVAIYPSEGTFYSDNPFIVLDAPWVRREQAEGARAFQRFLAERLTTAAAAREGFRPASLDAAVPPPITAANGADPGEPRRVLGLPEPRVLAAIKAAWREDRKPANILLVLDTSGSMYDERRLARAQRGLEVFFREVGDRDRVGLTTFSDEIRPLQPIRTFGRTEKRLREHVDGLLAEGGTAIYDATLEAFDTVRELDDRARINAVILLTDGEDTDSDAPFEEVVRRLEAQGDAEHQVRVFTIAYSAGAGAARRELARIAAASGGQSYEGTTEDIESVYRRISSFF